MTEGRSRGAGRGAERARRLPKNAALAASRFVVTGSLALVVTPYALRVLGGERFGLWALAGVVLSTVRLLDLGVQRSLTRSIARADALGLVAAAGETGRARPPTDSAGGGEGSSVDEAGGAVPSGTGAAGAVHSVDVADVGAPTSVDAAPGLARPPRETLTAALGLALVTAGTAVALAVVLRGPLLALLHVPPRLAGEASLVLVGTAVVAAIEMAFGSYAAALDGVGRMDLSQGIDLVQRVASAVGVVIVLHAGWGLGGLVLKNAVLALAAGLAAWLALPRAAPGLAGARPGWRPSAARELLRFGRHVQAVNVGAALIEPVNKGLLTRLVGLDAVAVYELAAMITTQVGGALVALVTALFPEAAYRGGGGRAQAQALWRRGEHAVTLLALGAYALLAGLAMPFVHVWLGPGYAEVGPMLVVLAGGWFIAVAGLPAFLVAQAAGEEGLSTRASFVTVGVTVAGAVVLIPGAGATGAAAARALGLALGGVAVWLLLARRWGQRPAGASSAVRAAVAAGLAVALARGVAVLAPSLAGVVVAGVGGAVAYGALAWGLGAVTTEEKAALRRLGGAPSRTRHVPDGASRDVMRAEEPTAPGFRHIAAVVPTWNAVERVGSVIEAVLPDAAMLVAVDNGSTDGTAEALLTRAAAEPRLVVLALTSNEGYPRAMNLGMEEALRRGADAVAWVNDDAVFEAGALGALAADLAAHPRAAAVSAKMIYAARPDVLNGAGGLWDADHGWAQLRGEGGAPDAYDAAPDPDYPSGAASLVRAAALESVGLLDESWFLYFEDADWGLRARAAGWDIRYCPAAVVRHAGSMGTASDPARRRYYNVRNRLRFARLHASRRGQAWTWAATCGLALKQPLRGLFPSRRRDAAAVAWAIRDYLAGVESRGRFDGPAPTEAQAPPPA